MIFYLSLGESLDRDTGFSGLLSFIADENFGILDAFLVGRMVFGSGLGLQVGRCNFFAIKVPTFSDVR